MVVGSDTSAADAPPPPPPPCRTIVTWAKAAFSEVPRAWRWLPVGRAGSMAVAGSAQEGPKGWKG